MIAVNYLAVGVAAVATVVVSTAWYMGFAKQMAALHSAYASGGNPPPWKVAVELVRSFVVGLVLAGVAGGLGIAGWMGAVQLALVLWIGFPVVLLVGSVQWEKVRWRLAAIHAGDWLLKLVLIAAIVGIWH